MTLLDYNKQTGDFTVSVSSIISYDGIALLKKIKDADGSFTMDTLMAERELAEDEKDESKECQIQLRMESIYDFQDLGLIHQGPIYDKGELKSWGYKLTDTGRALLKLTEIKHT